jgi:hypothetical protein
MIPAGARLRYLIGSDGPYPDQDEIARDNLVVEVNYGFEGRAPHPAAIKYGNLFDEDYNAETGTGAYGPYDKPSDTAAEWGEGQINPRGAGWAKNLSHQFDRAIASGFNYIELDNPDSYRVRDVLDAYRRAGERGLRLVAKNPGCTDYDEDTLPLVAHELVDGVIVEEGCGTPERMNELRTAANKPDLPVWFVAHGATQRMWAHATMRAIIREEHANMGVTHSRQKDYKDASDVFVPKTEKGC